MSMINQSLMVKRIVGDIVAALAGNSEIQNQLELFVSLRKGSVSVDEFFSRQKDLDEIMLKNSEEVDEGLLKKLNPKTYEHELKHKLVWDKYGVQTKFYCWYKRKNSYFVLDVNFMEVAKRKKFDSNQIVDIYKEMQGATFLNDGVHGYDVVMDILQYEVLNGLDNLSESDLYGVFSKYSWTGVQV